MYKKTYNSHYLEKLNNLFDKTKTRSYELLKLNSKDIVVDIGCGNGNDIINISKRTKMVYGIDHDIDLIEIAKKNNSNNANTEFICCEADNIPLLNQSIDKIRIDRVIQHLDNPENIIKEASRLLKKNGFLQIIDTDYLSWTFFLADIKLERKLFDTISNERFKGTPYIRKLPFILKEHNLKVDHFEVHNYIIKDFELANQIVRFDKIINEEYDKGNLTKVELDIWNNHKSNGQFNLSINLLLFTAVFL